jgi:hypothetical protein
MNGLPTSILYNSLLENLSEKVKDVEELAHFD